MYSCSKVLMFESSTTTNSFQRRVTEILTKFPFFVGGKTLSTPLNKLSSFLARDTICKFRKFKLPRLRNASWYSSLSPFADCTWIRFCSWHRAVSKPLVCLLANFKLRLLLSRITSLQTLKTLMFSKWIKLC